MRLSFKNKILFNRALQCSGKVTDLTKTIHKTIVTITDRFTKAATEMTNTFWACCIKTVQKKLSKTRVLQAAKLANAITHAFPILCNVSVVVVYHCKRLFPITACPSSFLKIFPDGAWWSNMNDISD